MVNSNDKAENDNDKPVKGRLAAETGSELLQYAANLAYHSTSFSFWLCDALLKQKYSVLCG